MFQKKEYDQISEKDVNEMEISYHIMLKVMVIKNLRELGCLRGSVD